MSSNDPLAQRFEESRPRLRAVALRMLGSSHEAEDAVQEAWLRVSRSDSRSVENPVGWLTTVVARVCLDMLRSRKARREDRMGESLVSPERGPESEALLADSVGIALLLVLETLPPAERVAFVLHDLFDVPFDEIASIVGRSSEATRQLASRARRRVRGADVPTVDHARQRALVVAFRAAARDGNMEALLAVLAPDIVLRADPAAVALGAKAETSGAMAVAETFSGRAAAAREVLFEGSPGLAWVVGGRPRVAFRFTIADDRIAAIDLVAENLDDRDLTILGD